MRRSTEVEATIRLGDATASIQRRGGEAAVAGILGIEDDGEGGRTIYLDRLVHAPWEETLGGYRCTGVVTTILNTYTPNGG